MNSEFFPGRVVLDIDHSVLRENLAHIASAVAPAKVIAVIKADAYGLGMIPIAKTLSSSGVAAIAVAEISEAQKACGHSVPVILLGSIFPDEIETALKLGVRVPLQDFESAKLISDTAVKLNVKAKAHIALDTGMGRVGIPVANIPDVISKICSLPGIEIEGMYSHFPMAYAETREFTLLQIEKYKTALAFLRQHGINCPWRHIANSDGINNIPESYREPFTHVRTGINLHGSFDTVGRRTMRLKSVLTLRTRLAQVRTLPAGSTIGYGATFVTPVKMRVGLVAAGYADGLPLALSNRGTMLVNGLPCPVLGRVCMDYTTVSLEQAPEAKAGDQVICLGGSGPGSVSVEDWATLKGTHPYEVICSIGSRVSRNHINT